MMPVYRAPMRSRLDDVDPALAVERALRLGLVGVGGRLARTPRSLREAVGLTDEAWGERAARRLERFVAVADGSQVWTRDPDGIYHVGVVEGAWFYDDSDEARQADLVHVRPCAWAASGPPTAVLDTFGRGGRNFQRIRALD